MKIIIKNFSINANYFIRLVERYHNPLCYIYNIITIKFPKIKPKLALQMFFKVLNDLARANDLVFNAYLYMTDINALLTTINQRKIAMRKAIEEDRRSHISCQLNNALNT